MSIWGDAAMKVTRRWAATVGLGCLVLTGCGERANSPEAPPAVDVAGAPDSGGSGQGAPGAPKPGGGGGPAPGSPMHMPARTEDQGSDLDEKLAYIKHQLTAECGGHLCVKITVEYSHDGKRCKYYDSRPAPDAVFRYRKNMTVTIIAGSEPCEEESVEPSESESPSASSSESPSESPSPEESQPDE
jgi:hypothetical protein